MATVTLHKNCKLTPSSMNAVKGESVSFAFSTSGTLNLNPSSFFGQATISSAGNLTIQPGAGSSCTITVASGTCTPTAGEGPEADSDSCVITVTSTDY